MTTTIRSETTPRYTYCVGGDEYARGTYEEIVTDPDAISENDERTIRALAIGETFTDGSELWTRIS